jgi:hypothetical protein
MASSPVQSVTQRTAAETYGVNIASCQGAAAPACSSAPLRSLHTMRQQEAGRGQVRIARVVAGHEGRHTRAGAHPTRRPPGPSAQQRVRANPPRRGGAPHATQSPRAARAGSRLGRARAGHQAAQEGYVRQAARREAQACQVGRQALRCGHVIRRRARADGSLSARARLLAQPRLQRILVQHLRRARLACVTLHTLPYPIYVRPRCEHSLNSLAQPCNTSSRSASRERGLVAHHFTRCLRPHDSAGRGAAARPHAAQCAHADVAL